jgi:hypothetical protein
MQRTTDNGQPGCILMLNSPRNIFPQAINDIQSPE